MVCLLTLRDFLCCRIATSQLSLRAPNALLLCAALLLPVALAHAANETITWGFSPTPTAVAISVGQTVTWSGDLNFHPVRITDATFATLGAIQSSGGASYARSFSAPGTYYFMCALHGASMPTTVTVACAPRSTLAVLDIDGNGLVEATTDGLLMLRYMLGLRGSALTAGALGVCASRDAAASESYLATRVVP